MNQYNNNSLDLYHVIYKWVYCTVQVPDQLIYKLMISTLKIIKQFSFKLLGDAGKENSMILFKTMTLFGYI